MKNITTKRLNLRLANAADAEFIKTLYNTEDFLQFVGDKNIKSKSDAEHYIENNILSMEREQGVCLLIVELKETQDLIGVCGLIKRAELTAYDIGYGFLPSSYGCGYGFEASRAIIEYARKKGIAELVAITTSDNCASRALLSKLGFTYVKVQEHLTDTIDLLLYQQKLV